LHRIHRQGYVHRDVSANNLLLASSNRLYLLDFEISWRVGDHAPPFQTGTLGFMSPQQQGRHARPTVADDVYGFGAVAFFALTGIDPVIMVGLSYAQRKRMIEDVLGEAAPISAMIADCMHPSATKRASLTTIESSLERACAVASMPRSTKRSPSRITGTSLERAIHSGLSGLNNSVLVDSASGLWLGASSQPSGDEVPSYDVSLHAHDGVAGAVYLISRLARCGVDIGPVLERFRSGVAALTEYIRGETGKLPGLNFGKAGIGVAFAEAFRAGLVDEDCISLLGSCRSGAGHCRTVLQ
jgi:serine/threonine protein kinase